MHFPFRTRVHCFPSESIVSWFVSSQQSTRSFVRQGWGGNAKGARTPCGHAVLGPHFRVPCAMERPSRTSKVDESSPGIPVLSENDPQNPGIPVQIGNTKKHHARTSIYVQKILNRIPWFGVPFLSGRIHPISVDRVSRPDFSPLKQPPVARRHHHI